MWSGFKAASCADVSQPSFCFSRERGTFAAISTPISSSSSVVSAMMTSCRFVQSIWRSAKVNCVRVVVFWLVPDAYDS